MASGFTNPEVFESPMPGMFPNAGGQAKLGTSTHRVRCYVADLTDLECITNVEDILTRGLDGKDIVIIDRDKYSFQDRYFMVVTYLEKV